jgi:transposase
MIQLAPQMRILVCVEPVDFRAGIDGLCRLCRQELQVDPFVGTAFVFRNRRGTSVKLLAYDGQGFWLATKRFSEGRPLYRNWPIRKGSNTRELYAHELAVLLYGGNPEATRAAPQWRPSLPSVTT